MTGGIIRTPTLWNVPTRSVPASALGERLQIGLGGAHCSGRSPCVTEQPLPASVGVTARLPPGRSSSCIPAARSSIATCWLMADCV